MQVSALSVRLETLRLPTNNLRGESQVISSFDGAADGEDSSSKPANGKSAMETFGAEGAPCPDSFSTTTSFFT